VAVAAVDAARALATVVGVRRMLAGRAIGALVETGRPALDTAAPAPPLSAESHALIGHWRAAVDRALAVLPGDRGCLVRATTLRRHLVAAGLDATVRIGVRRDGAQLDAHAWVEVDGHPVAEPLAHVAGFLPLDGVTLR
jgi:hypothetical protein